MNITIILPAVQVIKRDLDSPQPTTTPFPPVLSATPTPSCPHSPCSTSEYQEILEEYHRHVNNVKHHDSDISQSRVDLAARQAAYDYATENFQSPNISPTKSIEYEEEETEEYHIISRSRISSGQPTTESPSSADTVRTVRKSDIVGAPPVPSTNSATLESNNAFKDRTETEVRTQNDTREKVLKASESLHETDHETETVNGESASASTSTSQTQLEQSQYDAHADAVIIENNQLTDDGNNSPSPEKDRDLNQNQEEDSNLGSRSNQQILEDLEELIIIKEDQGNGGQPHIIITTQGPTPSRHGDEASSQNEEEEQWGRSESGGKSDFGQEEIDSHHKLPDQEEGHKSEYRTGQESASLVSNNEVESVSTSKVVEINGRDDGTRPVLRRQSRQTFGPMKTDSSKEDEQSSPNRRESIKTSDFDQNYDKKYDGASISTRRESGSNLNENEEMQVITQDHSVSNGDHASHHDHTRHHRSADADVTEESRPTSPKRSETRQLTQNGQRKALRRQESVPSSSSTFPVPVRGNNDSEMQNQNQSDLTQRGRRRSEFEQMVQRQPIQRQHSVPGETNFNGESSKTAESPPAPSSQRRGSELKQTPEKNQTKQSTSTLTRKSSEDRNPPSRRGSEEEQRIQEKHVSVQKGGSISREDQEENNHQVISARKGSEVAPATRRGSDEPAASRKGSEETPASRRGSNEAPSSRRESKETPVSRRGSEATSTSRRGSDETPVSRKQSKEIPASRRGSDEAPATGRGSNDPPTSRKGSEETLATRRESKETPASRRGSEVQESTSPEQRQVIKRQETVTHEKDLASTPPRRASIEEDHFPKDHNSMERKGSMEQDENISHSENKERRASEVEHHFLKGPSMEKKPSVGQVEKEHGENSHWQRNPSDQEDETGENNANYSRKHSKAELQLQGHSNDEGQPERGFNSDEDNHKRAREPIDSPPRREIQEMVRQEKGFRADGSKDKDNGSPENNSPIKTQPIVRNIPISIETSPPKQRKHSPEQQTKTHQSPLSNTSPEQHHTRTRQSPPTKSPPEQHNTRTHQSPPTKSSPEQHRTQTHQSPPTKSSAEQNHTRPHQSPPTKSFPEQYQTQAHKSPPTKSSPEQHQVRTHPSPPTKQSHPYPSDLGSNTGETAEKVSNNARSNASSKGVDTTSHRTTKPPAYPHRMTKTTIARQALAREKRRAYVEERIQSYMRSSQYASTNALLESYMLSNGHHRHGHRTILENDVDVPEYGPDELTAMRDKAQGRRFTKLNTTSMTSLPDINSYHHYTTYASSHRRGVPFSYHTDPHPHPPPPPPQTISAISIIKPPPPFHTPIQTNNNNNPPSHIPTTTTATNGNNPSEINTATRSNTSFHSETSHNSGIYVDSHPESTSNFWKNVSEQGFYYSFRVRQSGTVQMMDKSVQTGEQPQSYLLDFSRKPDGSYYLQNRDKILRDITETVQLRHDAELRRAELIQRANDLQSLVKEKREKINRRHEFWHKKYIEESSMTRPLEAACTSLRAELNTVHRRLIAHLEGRDLPLRLRDGPSKKANYKIMAARLQHEIKELQQKAKAAKLRLESEVKLKEQAEREVRDIRNDLSHKKVVMSLARSQFPVTHHPRAYETLVY